MGTADPSNPGSNIPRSFIFAGVAGFPVSVDRRFDRLGPKEL